MCRDEIGHNKLNFKVPWWPVQKFENYAIMENF
jgi:hypothetical protein